MKAAENYGPALEQDGEQIEARIHKGRKFGKKSKRSGKRRGRRKGRR
jgi:hypothetical protein